MSNVPPFPYLYFFLPESGIGIRWLNKAKQRTLTEPEIGGFFIKKSDRWENVSKCVSGR